MYHTSKTKENTIKGTLYVFEVCRLGLGFTPLLCDTLMYLGRKIEKKGRGSNMRVRKSKNRIIEGRIIGVLLYLEML